MQYNEGEPRSNEIPQLTCEDLKVVGTTVNPERASCFGYRDRWQQLYREPIEKNLAVLSEPLHILVCLGPGLPKGTYQKHSLGFRPVNL